MICHKPQNIPKTLGNGILKKVFSGYFKKLKIFYETLIKLQILYFNPFCHTSDEVFDSYK